MPRSSVKGGGAPEPISTSTLGLEEDQVPESLPFDSPSWITSTDLA